MFNFLANFFGYLLSFLYSLVNNYGLAIILFTIIIKLILLPLSIKQQKTMQKTAKIQEKLKIIEFKYKNNEEKKSQEMMKLYKDEKMNPFSGCLSAIIQLLLILSIFYLVRSPISYMQKVSSQDIEKYINQLTEEGKIVSQVYPQIDLIREANWLKEKNPEDSNIEKLNIQMNFLGLDLSKVPQQNMSDYTVYIIPILYIISSFISIRMTTSLQEKQNESKKQEIEENSKEQGKELIKTGEEEIDPVMQTNKMMSWMMPIMSISIAFIAPLGLALYWLISNILMIIERLILNKAIKPEAEEE